MTGVAVAAAAVLILTSADTLLAFGHDLITETKLAIAVAAALLFAPPLLSVTLLHSKLSRLSLKGGLLSTLSGRSLGLVGGVFLGLALGAASAS